MKHVSIWRAASASLAVVAVVFGLSLVPAARADEALPTDAQTRSVATNLGIYGGDNWDIAVDGDHVYTIASGVPNGFFYSTDAGVSWQRPTGTNDYGAGSAVEVDLTTHAVYVSLGGDLYKSTNYGVTLSKIADNIGQPLLFAQGRLFATSNDTVYVSSNDGASFAPVTIAGENVMSYAASKTAGMFHAVTRNAASNASKLYTSTDYGATWTAVTVDSSVTAYTNVQADPFDANILTLSGDNALWLSTNGGSSWTNIGTTASRPCGNFSVWTATRWYACAGYSTDNGSSWTEMDTHTNVMRGPGKIVVINAADENVMYGDCMSGVCKSTDGGLTWHNSLDGITGVNVLAISQMTNKNIVWISSSNGLGRTTNFTAAIPDWTWPILPCDPSPSARCDSSGIGESVWVKPNDANIVLAGSIGGWVYRSADGTAATPTWTAQVPSVVDLAKFKTGTWNNLRPKQFINDPSNPNTVYLAMYDPIDNNGAVLKSTDAGVTWTNMAITDDAPATTLALSKTGNLYVGTGYGSSPIKGVYKYAGGAWTKLSGIPTTVNINSIIVDPENQATVYATAGADARLGNDGFFRSTDNGATWKMSAGLSSYYGFGAITVQKSTTPNTLYMGCRDSVGRGVLLKSGDQGTTWGVMYTGLKAETFTTVLFDGLVVGSKHGLLSLKSRVAIAAKASAATIRKGRSLTLSTTLKDATTKRAIKNTTVELYRLSGKTWKKVVGRRTNSKGFVSFSVKPTTRTQYKLTWTPGPVTGPEYLPARSKVVTVWVKK